MDERLTELSDEELMASVSEGNLAQLRPLFDRYHIRIYNYVLKMSNDRDLSEDICQEVFYKIIKYRSSYKKTKFSPWIYRIARNEYLDHYHQEKKENQELEAWKLQISENSPKDRSEEVEQLNRAIAKLKEDEKELLLMNRYLGIKYPEIAEIKGSTIGAIKTKIHRIIGKLKQYYFQNTHPHEL